MDNLLKDHRWPTIAFCWQLWGSHPPQVASFRKVRARTVLSVSPRLDLHAAIVAVGVVTKATPLPIFGTGCEAPLHWIAVDVLELLNEFLMVPLVAVVVPFLPERALQILRPICLLAALGGGNLERLNHVCDGGTIRLGD